MNCTEAEYLAPLYWSNELEPKVIAELEEHLSDCAECARELQAQSQFDELLRNAVDQNAIDQQLINPQDVRTRVRREMRASESLWRRIFAGTALRLAAVSAVLLILLGGSLFYVSRQRAFERTLYADAADDHHDEVMAHLVDSYWRYRVADIQDLLQSWVGQTTLAQALTPKGYHLARARLCELQTQIYVHLVYGDGIHEVSIFVRRKEAETLAGRAIGSINGKSLHAQFVKDLQVAGFQSRDLTILVVTDMPRRDCLEIARQAASRV